MPDDYTATTETTGTVAVGGSERGKIETGGDRDWFAVGLVAGRVYRIDLEGSGSGGGVLRDPYLRGIHDADGNLIAYTTDDDGGERLNSRVYFAAEESGTYYVAAGAHGAWQGAYRLSVADVTGTHADDFAAGTGTSGAVAVNGSARGEIGHAGDRDWFAIELVAHREYRVDLKGLSTGDGTLGDPYLRGIHDADGGLIARTTNDDGGFLYNSEVTFTPTSDGTYYVAAGAYGDGVGTYRLSVADTDDYAEDTGTTGSVRAGGSVRGEIEFSGDRDWFAVELVAIGSYQLDLEGDAGDGDLDPYLRGVYNADGEFIEGTTDDDGSVDMNSRVTFEPISDGTYYVEVAAYSGVGAYTLSVSKEDDYAEWTGTTGEVAVGGSVRGEIDYENDRDWFAVTLEADREYRIDLEGLQTGGGALRDPYLFGIYDASGVIISGTEDDDGGEGLNSRLMFTPTSGGTYYVAAGSAGGASQNRVGSYKLSVTKADDYKADTGTTGEVAVDGSVSGRIDHRLDSDWFRVTLVADREYRIDLKGSDTGDGALRDPYLDGIHDADGVLIADTTDDDGGEDSNSRVYFTPTSGGTYYVAAGGTQNPGDIGAYTLSVKDITDDYAADNSTSGEVSVGGSARGEIDYERDRDWFAVTLVADREYRIDLKGSDTGDGALRDPYLRGVYDANGNRIAGTTNDDGGAYLNSRVTFTAAEAGTYYVAAGAYGTHVGAYTLSVKEVVDDYAADTGTAGEVRVGGSARGELEAAGDRDWFEVTLEADKTYRIDLEGRSTGAGTLFDPYLYGVHDSNGDRLAGTTDNNGGAGRNSRLYFTPEEAGTYYVAAGSDRIWEGVYRLSVTEIVDDYAADTGTAGAVSVDGSATGNIELAGDRDWFEVELDADTAYRIDLEGSRTGAGTLSDPYLYGVHDANGALIADRTDDDGGVGRNSRVAFVVDEAGTYYVAAGAWGGTGSYKLSVRDITATFTDDFEAGTGTSGTVTVGGSVTGEIEVLGDRDWFQVELEAGGYQVDLKGPETGDGALPNPYIYGVYDADGDLIAGTTNDDGGLGSNSRVYFTPAEAGTYYVAAGATGTHVGAYTLSVTGIFSEGSDDLAADTGTRGVVELYSASIGEIGTPGDRDWFAVEFEAGKSYRIDLRGAETGDGTLVDPYLYGIHDGNGSRISGTTNDDDDPNLGRNSRVYFAAAEDATYYVAAGGDEGNFDEFAVGTYTLSVTEVPLEEAVGDLGTDTRTQGVVVVGGSVTAEVGYAGDQDWFAVEFEMGKTYRIDLEGSDTGGGTLEDPFLGWVHDGNGDRIPDTWDDNGGTGRNSRVEFTATEDATYYVGVGGSETTANIYYLGTYTLSVEEVL